MGIKKTLACILSAAMILSGTNLTAYAQVAEESVSVADEAAIEAEDTLAPEEEILEEEPSGEENSKEALEESSEDDAAEEISMEEIKAEDDLQVEEIQGTSEEDGEPPLWEDPNETVSALDGTEASMTFIMKNGMILKTNKVKASSILPESIDGFVSVNVSFDADFFDMDTEKLVIPSSVTVKGQKYTFDALGSVETPGEDSKISKIVIEDGFKAILGGGSLAKNYTDVPKIEFPSNIIFTTEVVVPAGARTNSEIGAAVETVPLWTKNLKTEGGVAYIGSVAAYIPGGVSQISIKDGTTQIAPYAASGNQDIVSVTLPASVETVSAYAFAGCGNMTTFTIPENSRMGRFGYDTFGYCQASEGKSFPTPKLKEIFIPGATLRIGAGTPNSGSCIGNALNDAFHGASTLEKVTIGATDSENLMIGVRMFKDCSSLKEFVLPSNVTYIGMRAFSGCTSLETFTIPTDSKLSYVDYEAFGWHGYVYTDEATGQQAAISESGNNPAYVNASTCGAPIRSIYLPAAIFKVGVSSYSSGAGTTTTGLFAGNTALESLTIGQDTGENSKKMMASTEMFMGCHNLKEVKGMENLHYFGMASFADCTALSQIDLSGAEYIDCMAFDHTGLTEVTIPETVTKVGYTAFGGCPSLTKMHFNTTLGMKDYNSNYSTGYQIMDMIGISGGMSKGRVTSFGDLLKSAPMSYERYHELYPLTTPLREITFGLVDGQTYLDIIPNACITLGALEKVVLPEGMKRVSNYAFFECFSLKEVNMPKSIQEIGAFAFGGDPLVDFDFSKLENLTLIGDSAFRTNQEYGSFYNSSNATSMPAADYPGGFKELIFPKSLKTIGDGAFFGQRHVKKVVIPSNVEKIGKWAFQFLMSLEDLTLDSSAISKDDGSNCYDCQYGYHPTGYHSGRYYLKSGTDGFDYYFWNNHSESLKRIELGEHLFDGNVGSFGSGLFAHVPAEEVIIKADYDTLPRGFLVNAKNLQHFELSDKCKTISNGAFADTISLAEMILPESVEIVEICAFVRSKVNMIAVNNRDTVIQQPYAIIHDADDSTYEKYYVPGADTLSTTKPTGAKYECTTEVIIGKTLNLYDDKEGILYDENRRPVSMKIETEEDAIVYAKNRFESYYPIPKQTTIMGYTGSDAEDYARAIGNPFKAIDGAVTSLCGKSADGKHHPVLVEGKEATCQTTGLLEAWKCEGCGLYFANESCSVKLDHKKRTIPTVSHDILPYTQAVAATCEADGTIASWKCRFCDAIYADPEGTEEIDPADVIIPKKGHTIVVNTTAVAATCEEEGIKASWKCTECEKLFSDAEGKTEMNSADVIIAKKGHTIVVNTTAVAATCEEEGIKASWKCENCGKLFADSEGQQETTESEIRIAKLGHNFVGEVTKEPSSKGPGEMTYTCTRPGCGESYTEEIPFEGREAEVEVTLGNVSAVVTIDADGGELADDIIGEYSRGAFVLAKPTKTGHSFDGWYDESGTKLTKLTKSYLLEHGAVLMDSGSKISLTARWSENTYKVAYAANGGTLAVKSASERHSFTERFTIADASMLKPRFGYTFTGWNTAKDGSGQAYAAGQENVSGLAEKNGASVSLYAQWEKQGYPVTYVLNGGTQPLDKNGKSYNPDVHTALKVVTLKNPVRNGYKFGGWFETADFAGAKVTKIAKSESPITLYAKWIPNTYKISFQKNGGRGTMKKQSCVYDESVVLNANTFRKTGYTFKGWAMTKTGDVVYADGAEVLNLSEKNGKTVTLYAIWQKQ